LGLLFPTDGKIENVPNHQPVHIYIYAYYGVFICIYGLVAFPSTHTYTYTYIYTLYVSRARVMILSRKP
jgi:hypothetical protein